MMIKLWKSSGIVYFKVLKFVIIMVNSNLTSEFLTNDSNSNMRLENFA